MTRFPLLGWLVALYAWPHAAGAQGLVVTVTSAETEMPIPGAVVRAVRLQRIEITDRLGRARFTIVPRPDTLIAAAVGFRPDTLVVEEGVLIIDAHLLQQPVTLADLTVSAEGAERLAPSLTGQWIMPRQVIRNLPAAIEEDPLRALTVVPSVTFSSPFSGRPLIRGYEAAQGVVRIDGFEILNPYHLGRIFSSFPAAAVETVALIPIPTSSADGGTLSGVVDIRGRNAADGTGLGGGLDLSLVSATGWLGTPTPTPIFVSVRAAFLQAATDLVSEAGVPYNFQDLYARSRFSLGSHRSWDITLYASTDDFSDRQFGRGMDWSNLLFGHRLRLADAPGGSLDLIASANRFVQDAADIEARNSRIDVTNRFSRVSLGLSGELRRGTIGVSAGGAVGQRRITNILTVRQGDDFSPSDRDSRLSEVHAFVEGRADHGPLTLAGGLRMEASEATVAWQPRVRVSAWIDESISASITGVRTSRLYHLITDPQPEPSISFYDFWFNAGDGDVPVPAINHVAAALDGAGRSWSGHAGVFFSRGSGLGELRPVWDQRTGVPPFRYGDSRTYGLEMRAAWQPLDDRGPSGALIYVWSHSDRRWDQQSWRPWRLDRRHNVRLQIDATVSKRWYLFGTGEFLSGQPITPVAEVVQPVPPSLPGDTSTSVAIVRYRFGSEGIARSAGTYHFDFGLRGAFGGPWGSRLQVGLSVLNLTYGSIAPEVPVDPFELISQAGTPSSDGVQYKRAFSLPPVPSITVRIEF